MKKLKKRILVVLGGNSQERKVSLETGKACIKSIKKLGYQVQTFDPANKSFFKISNLKIDIIFNALHGRDGEDGNAQSYFSNRKARFAFHFYGSKVFCLVVSSRR